VRPVDDLGGRTVIVAKNDGVQPLVAAGPRIVKSLEGDD